MGEPAGIGGEIALLAWQRRTAGNLPPFFLIDDPARLRDLAARLGWQVPIHTIETPAEALPTFGKALPVLSEPLAAPVIPGRPDAENASAVLRSIDRAVMFAKLGAVAGIVTNPIAKDVLYRAGFRHPGHTEYLAHLTGAAQPAMMLAVEGLRVVLATIHLSLRDAVGALSVDAIVQAGKAAHEGLQRDFGIARPRLVVAALNPHGGEQGALGREEIDIVQPAVAALKLHGINATGPFPADTLFHHAARQGYDAAVCLYHDQALVPLKTIDFEGGVNVTLGLPIVRTSPDHGTAFGIAGRGTASPASLMAALRMATEISERRSHARNA